MQKKQHKIATFYSNLMSRAIHREVWLLLHLHLAVIISALICIICRSVPKMQIHGFDFLRSVL